MNMAARYDVQKSAWLGRLRGSKADGSGSWSFPPTGTKPHDTLCRHDICRMPCDAVCLPGCGSRSHASSPRFRPVPRTPESAAVDSAHAAVDHHRRLRPLVQEVRERQHEDFRGLQRSTPLQPSSFCTEEFCNSVVGASPLLRGKILVDVLPIVRACSIALCK